MLIKEAQIQYIYLNSWNKTFFHFRQSSDSSKKRIRCSNPLKSRWNPLNSSKCMSLSDLRKYSSVKTKKKYDFKSHNDIHLWKLISNCVVSWSYCTFFFILMFRKWNKSFLSVLKWINLTVSGFVWH